MARWPAAKRLALIVTVDFAGTSGILAQVPEMAGRDKSLSVWSYGAKRGVDRLLRVFDEFKVTSSWLVAGRIALEHAQLVRRIHAAGHEIGNLGAAAEDFGPLSLAAQTASFEQTQTALTDIVGVAPAGFRSAFGNWAPGFTEVLRRAGVRWSSSWRGDDRPYFHPTSGAAGPPLVELPLHYELEDEPFFAFNLYPPVPPGQPRIAPYRDVLANWQQDLAGFRRLGLLLPLRLHPEILGTAGRIDVLREFLHGALKFDDVWIASGSQLAEWWSQNNHANEPGHPVDLFAPLHAAPVVT
jgi:peptidoglycan/xylan/chitin deacetylase (PgdA/CDA1 family)